MCRKMWQPPALCGSTHTSQLCDRSPTCRAAASLRRLAILRCTSSLGHSRLQQCCSPDGCTLKRMLTRCRAAVAAASRLSCRIAIVLMDSLHDTAWHSTAQHGAAPRVLVNCFLSTTSLQCSPNQHWLLCIVHPWAQTAIRAGQGSNGSGVLQGMLVSRHQPHTKSVEACRTPSL
jgi:hypothetical protein